jgi:hypothetical protein
MYDILDDVADAIYRRMSAEFGLGRADVDDAILRELNEHADEFVDLFVKFLLDRMKN